MAQSIRKLGIVGAGQMGNGIAHVCSLAGIPVVIHDASADRVKDALATINGNMAREVSRQRIKDEDRQAALKRISTAETARRARRLRSRHRGRDREGRGQAQDLHRAVPDPEAGGDRRHQHLVDLDHPACRLDRPAGEVHRHSFHESGAAHGAGRAHPRHRHRRRDVRGLQGVRRQARQDRSPSPRTSPPSSSTASCCR